MNKLASHMGSDPGHDGGHPHAPGPGPSASRYELLAKIASGGMATVYVGRLRGSGGFSRTVAIKRAHPHLLEDPTYRTMLVEEARVAAKLHHPNVVAVLDVEELAGELSLVMDYVEGTSLFDLIEAGHAAERPVPPRIAVRVALDACAGLHAAHTLCDEDGRPLELVHRDVSPHNILVGLDGVARLSDFGIAKSVEGAATTTGVLKGKLGYMAPEYLEQTQLDARSDVFSLGVVVWEALADQKLFRGASELETFKRVIATVVPPISSVAPWVNSRFDDLLASALARAPDQRFQTAQAFGTALETAARRVDMIASASEVGAYLRDLCGAALAERRAEVRGRTAPIQPDPPPPPPVSARHDRPTLPDKPSAETRMDTRVEASGLKLRRDRASADPPPPLSAAPFSDEVEVEIPTSGGWWKVALGVAALAAVVGGLVVLAMRSGDKAPPVPAGAPPAVSASAAAPPPAPTPEPPPTAAPVPSAATARPALSGHLPGKAAASARASTTATATSFPIATAVPLSAWPMPQPPPPPDPAPAKPEGDPPGN
jgi:eukaryotic-like serine/threonine-protein kinase